MCHDKAVWAVQNPRLCEICSGLFTDRKITQALFSEDGYTHRSRAGLEEAAGDGCGCCRFFLLQDPNPDPNRLHLPLSLFAEGNSLDDGSGLDVRSLYFSSLEGMFRLNLSVAALGNSTPPSEFEAEAGCCRQSCDKVH